MSLRTPLSTILAAAVLVPSVLTLSACNKSGSSAPATSDTSSAVASSSAPVAAAEDATAGAVGQVAAATTLTAQGFVNAAGVSDMYEIQAARIAQQKSANPAVKKFAAHMIHDHTGSSDKLKALLAKGDIKAVPPADLDERRKGLLDNLNAAGPQDFDKTYVDQQVAAHEEAVTLFKGFAAHGDNEALKGFAATVLPTIQDHLAMIKDLRLSMK
jgi:putative membrane protein